MKTKPEIDREVAFLLGVPQRKVADITTAYVEVLKQELLDHGAVHIHMFGRISIHYERAASIDLNGNPRAPYNCKVHFAKSKAFKAAIERYFNGKRR